MDISLVIPAFIAGLLTFLAPCTLPLVPGYLGFISGVSLADINDPLKARAAKRKIFINGLLYVVGFSSIFILLGALLGLGGILFAPYKLWLTRAAGVLVIIFGLQMMHVLDISFLNREARFKTNFLKPGDPLSSLLFGMAFAFGWTPCVGPVLATVLALASSTATVGQAVFLLFVFSLGLAVPFLLIAAGIGSASSRIKQLSHYLKTISIIGGIFLVALGVLLLTGKMNLWIGYFYQLLTFIGYDRLINYL
ncbi:MAG: sulfite exporter TauE/SafE family protein [Candidatus Magasanikbacteria bacterium]|nr:sulfite exporter TauE/SafE family protein [Candidatus Magasanikbacteria bacterium]